MPLVYLPDRRRFFHWGDDRPVPVLADAVSRGQPATATVVAPGRRGARTGVELPLPETVASLAVIEAADVPALPGSVAFWTLAGRLALDLVSRERVVPTVTRNNGGTEARWAAALAASGDAARVGHRESARRPGRWRIKPT